LGAVFDGTEHGGTRCIRGLLSSADSDEEDE
jgi:hypothetical protein